MSERSAMSDRKAIILVPGLFGFATIGDIAYFDRVIELLASCAAVPSRAIFVLKTLPTGALWQRVRLLHEEVEKRRKEGFSNIHLVGHSTGGVDVRLFTNDAFLWPGGPCKNERSANFSAIGRVVSISAPQRGTPIAVRLRGAMENAIPFLFLLSLLAKSGQRGVMRNAARPLALAFAAVRKGIAAHSHVESALQLSGLSPTTAKQASDFLTSIADDHPLIHELTPLAMSALNAQIANGHQLPISSFVTVAPPPWPHVARLALGTPWVLTPLQRLIYAFSFESTLPDAAPLSKGPWLAGVEPPRLSEIAAYAQDGVVPSASQSLDENVAGLVYGDHLDVVGHYRGMHGGETVFDSGASFDDERMTALWTAVGDLIR